jgi:hypothetical protein
MEDTVLSLRIVTTSAVFLTLAAGSASAQSAMTAEPGQTTTITAPGKPLQLFQIIQQKDGTAVRIHHRARYVRRKAAETRVANQTTGTARHTYMQMQPAPEPELAAATPLTATTAVPANIWPAPGVTLPGTQAQGLTPTPPEAPTAAPDVPAAAASRSDMLTAAYDAVQVTPPNAMQATPADTAQVASPSTPEVAQPNAVQVAKANTVSLADVAAEEPHDATNTAKASNPVPSWPVQHAMVATVEPENPNPVGSVSWIVHVLAALGATIAAGALAWVLINPLPARSYQ